MRTAVLIVALAATAARGEDNAGEVRQLVGLSASLTDAGFGLGAQLGVRSSPVLLRLTLDLGGGVSRRGFIAGAVRGSLVSMLSNGSAWYAHKLVEAPNVWDVGLIERKSGGKTLRLTTSTCRSASVMSPRISASHRAFCAVASGPCTRSRCSARRFAAAPERRVFIGPVPHGDG